MKYKLFIFIAAFSFSMVLFAQDEKPKDSPQSEAVPVFSWEDEVIDFGAIVRGVPVTAEFIFKNSGKAPLVLKDVRKSCGCTSVSFPREPIMPGKSETIKAEYDASSLGSFNKKLTVLANTKEGMHYLTIKGVVE